jgi:hypothetical protein
VTAERGRAAPESLAREYDDRSHTRSVEASGLKHPVGERTPQHDDGVGVRGQRIGDHQEAAGVAHGEHGEHGQHDDGGEGEPRATHGAGRLRTGWAKGKPPGPRGAP